MDRSPSRSVRRFGTSSSLLLARRCRVGSRYRQNGMVSTCRISIPHWKQGGGLGCLRPVSNIRSNQPLNLPLGRLDLWISKAISIVWVIWSWQSSDPAVHIGRTSIDILCHDESNNLCPSKRLEIPALPLHGSSFKKGVKFSVHTTSLGNVP